MKESQFDNIRPYNAEEFPKAMQRIANSSSFPILASFVYPGEPLEEVRQRIANYKNVYEFQSQTMSRVNERVIEESISEFTCSGIERLRPNRQYLYVSNHRDIMLDASLLQYFLLTKDFDTTEITFGANLMSSQLVIDIGKSNKMFKVERPGGSIKDFYRSSLHLSEYIRYAILEKHQSVWIAQRNGRTKDGIDSTDQGIIKMFCMSRPDDKIQALSELNIVPVAVSYEWESCDILKAIELYQSQYTKYIKKPGEDLNSILTGLLQRKGRVHFELCEPITEDELMQYNHLTNNEYHKAVAQLIDSRIIPAYRLWPNNYIAHDIRYGSKAFQSFYTKEQREAFLRRLSHLDRYDDCDLDQLKDIFLSIYSNPIERV